MLSKATENRSHCDLLLIDFIRLNFTISCSLLCTHDVKVFALELPAMWWLLNFRLALHLPWFEWEKSFGPCIDKTLHKRNYKLQVTLDLMFSRFGMIICRGWFLFIFFVSTTIHDYQSFFDILCPTFVSWGLGFSLTTQISHFHFKYSTRNLKSINSQISSSFVVVGGTELCQRARIQKKLQFWKKL